ncbi:MAG: hypothetical protein ACRC8K_13460 [Waterburya sp.]
MSLFIVTWGLLAIHTKSAIAQTVTTESLSTVDPVSTQAIDLLNSSKQQKDFLNNPSTIYQLAQRPLDLAKFCQNYPYNSQCTQTKPVSAPEKSPKRSEDSQDVSQEQPKSGWAIVPEISTLGLGGHVVRKITPQFNGRVGINAFSLGLDGIDTDIDYDADFNLFNVSTLVDFQPFKSSGFRVSGGLVFGNNNFEGTADISEQVVEELEDTIDTSNLEDVDGLATADADVDITNSVSPYLGIGGGNPVANGKGLGFWWNLGVIFGGSPDIEVTPNVSDQVPENEREEVEAAANQVVNDEEEEIEDVLDIVNIYPVLSLGLSYQF